MLKSGADVYKYLAFVGLFGFLITIGEFFLMDEIAYINYDDDEWWRVVISFVIYVIISFG